MDRSLLDAALILLAASALAVGLARRLGLPTTLGYLAVGVLVGPYGFHWVPDSESSHTLAELGVVFLMFSIGLEFSLPRLLESRGQFVQAGAAQMAVSTAVFAVAAWLAGVSPSGAFVLGAALAVSSTAIVFKALAERMELSQSHGELAVGILLFQDLATVPMLVLVATLATPSSGLALEILSALLRGSVVLAVLLLAGRRLLHPLLRRVAWTRSAELFMIVALLLALGAARLSEAFGLSTALGAFMAGMTLGETEFRHQVEADVRPFQDLLLGLFFVTIGMDLNTSIVIANLPAVAVLLPLVVLTKILIVFLIAVGLGRSKDPALRAGLCLAQAGEFGLLLLARASENDLVPPQPAQIVLATMVLSIVLAPILLHVNGRLATFLLGEEEDSRPGAGVEGADSRQAAKLTEHAILCGFGRLGQHLARALELEGIPWVALDLDVERVRQASASGARVAYGDAQQPTLLDAAGIRRARALVITFDDVRAAERIVRGVRLTHPELLVLVRSVKVEDLPRLYEAGATEVLADGLEVSLTLSAQLLLVLGVPFEHVEHRLEEMRAEEYRLIRPVFHDTHEAADENSRSERLSVVTLRDGSTAVGLTLDAIDFGSTGARLLSVARSGLRIVNPANDFRLRAGDVLMFAGKPDGLARVEELLLGRYA
jgi:CPA2 family monovalent cation:H+ antiporter-2